MGSEGARAGADGRPDVAAQRGALKIATRPAPLGWRSRWRKKAGPVALKPKALTFWSSVSEKGLLISCF
jgi:hypothetical protein